MLSVVEKVILLQNVDVFSEVPAEQLAYLAVIAEELSTEADERIFAEEDPADSMYVVLEGRVRLHRGSVSVTSVGPGEAFGTWALFDEEPRVMGATVEEGGDILRIDRMEFIEVLADNVQITQGVLKAIARRLRALGRSVSGPKRP